MGKKLKKNRFNRNIDVDLVYSSNTIAEVDPTDSMKELNITREKAEELQKIRATLPMFSSATPLEVELAKMPTERPFKAFVSRIAFTATEDDVAKFFSPLQIVKIDMATDDGGCRGFCLIEFETRDDLAKALERTDCALLGRPVSIRIATPSGSDRGGGGFGRDRNFQSGFGRRSEARGSSGFGFSSRDDSSRSSFATDSGWKRGDVISGNDTGAAFSQPRFSSRPMPTAPPVAGATDSRPKLQLNPRTIPLNSRPTDDVPRNTKIFGLAKPVDTASKDREIEQRHATSAASYAATAQ